jgi:hypothetical protein
MSTSAAVAITPKDTANAIRAFIKNSEKLENLRRFEVPEPKLVPDFLAKSESKNKTGGSPEGNRRLKSRALLPRRLCYFPVLPLLITAQPT